MLQKVVITSYILSFSIINNNDVYNVQNIEDRSGAGNFMIHTCTCMRTYAL